MKYFKTGSTLYYNGIKHTIHGYKIDSSNGEKKISLIPIGGTLKDVEYISDKEL